MSVYDAFQQEKGSETPTSPSTPPPEVPASSSPAPTTGVFGSPQEQEEIKSSFSSAPAKPSVYDSFKQSKAQPVQKSVYDQFKQVKQVSATPSPYFYTKTPSGATIGASDQLDTSGKPLLAYRNPGDTSTTTDTTRVATTFDPRVAQKISADTFMNPRSVSDRAALKTSMGGTYSDELDHQIALEVSGSNNPSNLKPEPLVPGTKNTATDPLENSLAKDVASGKISLFDAQLQLAKTKGIKAPWVPPEYQKQGKSAWDNFTDFIKNTGSVIKNFLLPTAKAAGPENAPSVYDQFKATQGSTNTQDKPILINGVQLGKGSITNPNSLDVYDSKGNYMKTFSGPNAGKDSSDFVDQLNEKNKTPLEKERDQLDADSKIIDTTDQKSIDAFNSRVNAFNEKIKNSTEAPSEKASVTPSNSFGSFGRVVSAMGDTFMNIVNDAAGKMTDFIETSGDKNSTVTDRTTKLTEAVLGGLNVAWSPFSMAISGAKSSTPGLTQTITDRNGKQIGQVQNLSIQSIGNAVNDLFQEVASGSKTEIKTHLDSIPSSVMSDETKSKIEPVLTDIATLVNSFALGHVANVAIKTDFSDKIQKLGNILDAQYKQLKEIPNKQGGFVKIGGDEPVKPDETKKEESTTPLSPIEPVTSKTPEITPTEGKGSGPITGKEIVGDGTDFQKIENNTQNYVNENKDALISKYEETHGNVYNVDNMKELIPGHADNRTISEAFHRPTAELIGNMIDKKLQETKGSGREVIFTGGATGAGKSTAIDNLRDIDQKITKADAVVDGTLADVNRSSDNIKKALQTGHEVRLLYVDVEPKQLIKNLITRAQEGGRTVPIETAYNTLLSSRQNVLRLNGKFGANENFGVDVVHNYPDTPGRNYVVENPIDYLTKKGYSKEDISLFKKDAYLEVERSYKKGEITQKQYNGFTRRKESKIQGEIKGTSTERSKSPNSSSKEASSKEGKEITSKEVRQFAGEEHDLKSDRKDISIFKKPEIENPLKLSEREKANREYSKEEIKADNVGKKTPIEKKLDDLITHREFIRESIKNDKARQLSKYAGPDGLGEVTGEEGGIWKSMGDQKSMDLGYKDSETARVAYENYRLLLKRLGAINEDIASVRRELSVSRAEDKDAKSLNHLLNKTATKTDIDLARQSRILDLKKAELETQNKLKEEETKQTSLQEKINAAKSASEKSKGLIGKVWQALRPSYALDKVTKPIIEKWFQGVIDAKQKGLEVFNKALKLGPQDFKEIIDFQAGKQTPYIRDAFDTMGTDFKRRGLNFGWLDNYMPDVWKDSPQRQAIARTAYLKTKGMTDKEIGDYLKGVPLEEGKALRLKLRPNFSKERFWPDYVTGMKHGLTPKYSIPADLIAYYKEAGERAINNINLINNLKTEAKLLHAEDAPDTWHPVTLRFSKEGLYAPPALAELINGKFRDDDHLNVYQTVVKGISLSSRFLQNMVVSGGIPGTILHPFGFAQAYRIATTMIGDIGTLKFRNVLTDLNASFAFIRANSNALSIKWFKSKEGIIAMMAKNGIDLTDRVGGRGYKNLYNGIRDAISTDKGAKGLMKTTGAEIKFLFHKAIPEKAFQSLMPQIKISVFEGAYKAALAHGLPEEEAQKLAANTTKASEGITEETGRSKTTKDTLSSLFFAPSYREGLVNIFTKAGRSFTSDFGNPAYTRNRSFIIGLAVLYSVYNLINKELNGHYMWDNPPGRELGLRIPLPNGDIVYTDIGPSLLTVPRNLIEGTSAFVKGDISTGFQKGGSVLSMPLQLITQLYANKDYFGNPIWNKNDSAQTGYEKMAAYIGLEASHPYVKELYKDLSGNEPLSWALINSAGLPVKMTNLAKEQSSAYYDNLAQKAKDQSAAKASILPFYQKLQDLKNNGQVDEANALYNAQSDKDKAVYDLIKKDEKLKDTKSREVRMTTVYQNLQQMKAEGRIDEANAIYFALSPADQHAYDLVKSHNK